MAPQSSGITKLHTPKEYTMSESIHGHEVLGMMIDSGRSWTSDTLIAEIEQRFGKDARFHTCSADGLSAAQLVDFLRHRGKFIDNGEDFVTDASKICNH